MPEITVSASREDVRELVRKLPAMLTGQASDPTGMVRGIQLGLGMTLLSKIQQSFITKAQGGTGEDGITWPKLKRETIAKRRIGKGDLASIGIKSAGQPKSRVRGLLTKSQDKEWKKIFATRKAWLMAKFGLGEADAGERAAQAAWAKVKGQGAVTKLAVLGGRSVEILRDTGELFRSLTPGVSPAPIVKDAPEVPGQVLRSGAGEVVVGTNKKPWHHRGIPGKLPARNLWPPDGNLPATWWDAVLENYRAGVLLLLAQLVSR